MLSKKGSNIALPLSNISYCSQVLCAINACLFENSKTVKHFQIFFNNSSCMGSKAMLYSIKLFKQNREVRKAFRT